MTEKRFIRTIAGGIYDSENDSFIHQDYVGKPIEYEDECIKLLNEQDQKIKAIEKLLDNELKKAFNNRINHDDYAENAELAEYFKGYHCGVGDLEKKIKHILFNK